MSSIFTQIIDGKIPGHFVWQDDYCVAIMTIQPVNPGHLLVIPRQEIDHWDDLSDDLASHLMRISKKLAKAVKKSFVCQRVGLVIAGFEVPHVHVHVMPANVLEDFNFTGLAFAEADDLQAAAERIKEHLI